MLKCVLPNLWGITSRVHYLGADQHIVPDYDVITGLACRLKAYDPVSGCKFKLIGSIITYLQG